MFFTLGGSFLRRSTKARSQSPSAPFREYPWRSPTGWDVQPRKLLLSIPEIKTVGRKTGRAELDEHAFGVNSSELKCPFELGRKTRKQLTEEVREKLSVLPGVNIEIGGPILTE